jgi:hypothetical protein
VTVTVNGCTSAAGTTSVVVNAIPATPVASNGGPYCTGTTISLSTPVVTGATYAWTGPNGFTSSSRTPTIASAAAANAGTYSVTVTVNGCTSAAGTTGVVVNALPSAPTASNTGPYCGGGTVQLNATTIAGATYSWTGPNGFTSTLQNPTIANATTAATGTYSVTATLGGCTSAAGTTSVTVNSAVSSFIFVTAGSPTFCAGGSVTLSSNFISGNQWRLNGTPIPNATSQTYVATASGSYTHIATVNGCSSPPSNAIVVTVNPQPSATISTVASIAGGTSATASVADAGAGATYVWTINNGTIDSGAGTRTIGFTAGGSGVVTLTVTVTASGGCRDTKSTNIPIPLTLGTISPSAGRAAGGTAVTLAGSGFQAGGTVTFGGVAATNVLRVSATTITATTPAHAAGAVTVVVTNPDNVSASHANGFTYLAQLFDPNNDHVIDPADVFYLVNYLFKNGPAPQGAAGMMSGDANGDGVVDPADIFYLVNFLFQSGPTPKSLPPVAPSGTLTLGDPVVRDGRTFVPVILDGQAGAFSLRVHVQGATVIAIRRTAGTPAPIFELAPNAGDYLVSFGQNAVGGVVAEIEVSGTPAAIELDRSLTRVGVSRSAGLRPAG